MDPASTPPAPSADDAVASIEARMRADLTGAMRDRDKVRIGALRTGLAAVANAEAPPMPTGPSAAAEPVVGALVEHRRLDLDATDVERILRAEIADREDTATQFEAHGRPDEAATVRAEAAVLASYLT